MDPVPPPHERSWRHPSELAPPPLEETPRRVRIAAAVTGAASVALVGLFALTVTPSNSAVVVSSSTLTPSATMATASPSDETVGEGDDLSNGAVETGDGTADEPSDSATQHVVVFVDSNTTITTSDETDDRGFPMATVRFSTRLSARGVLLDVVGNTAVLELDRDRPRDRKLVEVLDLPEYVVASSVPHRTADVTVMSGSPQQASLDELNSLDLEPGTVVLDENSHLIGVCDEHGKVELVAPDPDPVTSTTEDPTTVTTTTTLPDTTEVPDPTTTTTRPDTATTPPSTTVPDTSTSTTTTEPSSSSEPDDTDTTTSTTIDDTSTRHEPTTTRPPPSDGPTTQATADSTNDESD